MEYKRLLSVDLPGEIYEAVTRERQNTSMRKYLGMSMAGDACARKIWYALHKFSGIEPEGRTLLIFEMGDHVEQILARWLRGAGYLLEHAYPDRQLSFEHFGGILRGHCDGVIKIGENKAILECKSAKDKKFKAFVQAGVKTTYPVYYAQTQFYMGFAQLPYTVFLVMNKDNCEIYQEIIPFDAAFFAQQLSRLDWIIRSRIIPDKTFDAKSFDCQWCDYRIHCHNPTAAIQTWRGCMSCYHMVFDENWQPRCDHEKHKFALKDPWISCPDYHWIGGTPF